MSELDKMSTDSLKKLAKTKGIDLPKSSKRQAILASLLHFEAEQTTDGKKPFLPKSSRGDDELAEDLEAMLNIKSQPQSQKDSLDTMRINDLRDLFVSKGGKHANKLTRNEMVQYLSKKLKIPIESSDEYNADDEISIENISNAVASDDDQPSFVNASQPAPNDILASLHHMNVPELKRECKKLHLTGYRKLHRQEIIQLLENHLSKVPSKDAKIFSNSDVDENIIGESERLDLLSQVRQQGYDIPIESITLDELKMRLSMDLETIEAWKEMGGEDWESLMQKASYPDMKQSNLLLVKREKSPDCLALIETSNAQNRISMLTADFGPITIIRSYKLNRPIHIRNMCHAYLSSSDWAKINDIDSSDHQVFWIMPKKNMAGNLTSFTSKLETLVAFNTTFNLWGSC